MKKSKLFLKILKYISLFIFTLIIIFLIVINISKQNLYIKSDFNIPDNFFDTIHGDKEQYSDENGFNEFIIFIKTIDERLKVWTFNFNGECDFLRKKSNICIDEKNRYLEELDEFIKEEDIEDNLKLFVDINNKRYKNIINNDYLLPTEEYTGFMRNNFLQEIDDYSLLIEYIFNIYIEEGNNDKALEILIYFHDFIVYLINNSDIDLYSLFKLLYIYENNLDLINNFIDNETINNHNKEIIYSYLGQGVDDSILINSIKNNYKITNEMLEYATGFKKINNLVHYGDENVEYSIKSVYDILKILLFYSNDETKVLVKKQYFDITNNTNNLTEYERENKLYYIHNFIGYSYINGYKDTYLYGYEGYYGYTNLIHIYNDIFDSLNSLNQYNTDIKSKLENLPKEEIITNFGSGFLLKQNDEITFVEYNGENIYEEKNELESFDSGILCDNFNYCTPEERLNIKDYNDLEKIKGELLKRIEVEYLFGNVFLINRYGYEGGITTLFNSKTLEKREINLLNHKEIYKNNETIILEVITPGGSFIKEINSSLEVKEIFNFGDGGNYQNKVVNLDYSELLDGILIVNYSYNIYYPGEDTFKIEKSFSIDFSEEKNNGNEILLLDNSVCNGKEYDQKTLYLDVDGNKLLIHTEINGELLDPKIIGDKVYFYWFSQIDEGEKVFDIVTGTFDVGLNCENCNTRDFCSNTKVN